jgi:hypothetical protein
VTAFVRLVLVALVPALVNSALAVHFFTAPARDSLPYYNDELSYWNQIATFHKAGFGGGYITANEKSAPLSWSHFGPHGPTFPVLYGSMARATGWQPSSAVDLNIFLVTAAALVWLLATRPPLLPAVFLFATFWPLALALTTTMQEPLQYALVLLLAAAIVRMVRGPSTPSARVGMAFAVAITIASLLRPSWALLLVPCLADRATTSPIARWGARAAGFALSLAAYALFFLVLGAPYPGGPGSRLSDLISRPIPAIGSVVGRFAANVERFLWPRDSALLEIFFRYEALLLAAVLVALAAARSRTPDDTPGRLLTIAAWFLALTVMGTLVVGDIESWRDYRVLTPVLFLTLLLAVNANWPPARIVFAAHLLLLPVAATTFAELYEPKFRADRTLVAKFADEAASVLTFQPGASGWTNTLLVPADRYEYPLLGVPAGIGISSFFGWTDVALPLKSRYLLLRPLERESAPPGVRLKKLRDTVHGTLYENLDARMLESRP